MTEREQIIEDINIQRAILESWTKRGSDDYILKEIERRETSIARLQNEILVLYKEQKEAPDQIKRATLKITNLQEKLHVLSVKPELVKLRKLEAQLKEMRGQIASLEKEKNDLRHQ